jgi:hypothetical protein
MSLIVESGIDGGLGKHCLIDLTRRDGGDKFDAKWRETCSVYSGRLLQITLCIMFATSKGKRVLCFFSAVKKVPPCLELK